MSNDAPLEKLWHDFKLQHNFQKFYIAVAPKPKVEFHLKFCLKYVTQKNIMILVINLHSV